MVENMSWKTFLLQKRLKYASKRVDKIIAKNKKKIDVLLLKRAKGPRGWKKKLLQKRLNRAQKQLKYATKKMELNEKRTDKLISRIRKEMKDLFDERNKEIIKRGKK